MACTANGAVPGYLFPSSDRAAFCLERIYAAPSPSSAAPKHPTHPTLSPSSLSTTVDHSPISRTIVPSCHPDMISLSISASSSHVDLMSGPPSLRYQASIYSTHSHSYPYRHGYRSSRNTSLEQLVPKKRVRFEGKALPADRTHNSKRGMSSNGSENGGVAIERKMSYGIGGAGNIRRPSDVIYPVRLNADGTRRRSSVWSTSPDGKRAGILSLFRRSNTHSETSNRGPDDNASERG